MLVMSLDGNLSTLTVPFCHFRHFPCSIHSPVLVSKPEITAIGRVIVGKPFQVRCHSDRGSLPIEYTLWKKYSEVNSTTVQQPHHQAIFPVTVQHYSDMQDYKCEARNNPKIDTVVSNKLNTTVIGEPVESVEWCT